MIDPAPHFPSPVIAPLGDSALLVRFGTSLSDEANLAAIAFARLLAGRLPDGVIEIDPNLVSVLLRYDPDKTDVARLAGEIRLLTSLGADASPGVADVHRIAVRFGGEDGPDLDEVSEAFGMTPAAFVDAHNGSALRVLTTGFAPG